MHTRELLERLARIGAEITMLYGELSEELPQLRITVDNTHGNSELKKIPLGKYCNSRGIFIERVRATSKAAQSLR